MVGSDGALGSPANDPVIRLCREWAREFSKAAHLSKFDAADGEWEEICDRADSLMEAIRTTSAVSLTGVIMKLSVAIEWGRIAPQDMNDPPWPCVASALADLRRLARDDTNYLSTPSNKKRA